MEATQTNTHQAKQTMPNSTTILVLGICSIATCWCTGLIGLGLGITTLILSKKARLLHEAYPDSFTESSLNNMKAGKICGIIGVCLSALALAYFAIYIIVFGFIFSQAGFQNW